MSLVREESWELLRRPIAASVGANKVMLSADGGSIENPASGRSVNEIENPASGRFATKIDNLASGRSVNEIENPASGRFAIKIENLASGRSVNEIENLASGRSVNEIENLTGGRSVNGIENLASRRSANKIENLASRRSVNEIENLASRRSANKIENLAIDRSRDEAKATYNETLSALDGYFNSKKNNTIFARAIFNRRVQQSGESVDAFIQDLHRLADECNYLTLKEELIRDRIVVGVRDDELSKQLQGKQDLDLTGAIRLGRQAEARTEGRNVLRPRVDLVHKFKPAAAKRFSQPKQQPQPSRANPGKKCGNCDLGKVDAWTAELHVDGYPSTFKLDTGAAVSVVGEDFADGRDLQPSDKILRGPGNTPLHVLGVFQACLKYKNRKIREALYIIQGQQHCLLSGSACARLGLVARLHSLTSGKADFIKEFPSLFKGLGKLKDPYTIKIHPGVQPSSINTPRKIPHPLMDKVKAEINRMLDDDVISPVEEPTEWCSGIVVVPKADRSSVRICVDLTYEQWKVKTLFCKNKRSIVEGYSFTLYKMYCLLLLPKEPELPDTHRVISHSAL
ncbi:Zinc knuckle domain containing protein [Plakobranchus ocellatus]|uniref:Zinc knuckle domain containing protein n=1 Tax=Plakobranchus ocellatus TaxID=259542 RepID=A0AAV4B4P4_9GAST|nr:Zinc knuckle domain containing protein [Plakobranchus ocellatus]